ncbi:MAG: hypothetical protein H9W82_12470 [Lactobacillus sp.]|nr:hypothetical protein [Lactobacillus sp.]
MQLYDENETMLKIGELTMSEIVSDYNLTQLMEIEQAHNEVKGYVGLSALTDAFMLGYTYGQKNRRLRNCGR